PMLSAIGLAHDLGNPPFGHRGETAIGRGFERHQDWIFTKVSEGDEDLPVEIEGDVRKEFTGFDGNPQTMMPCGAPSNRSRRSSPSCAQHRSRALPSCA
ncbi:HD domain-containing protein, partial [Escherichia coli]|nr:HD domain-containing protein [Escherichia coli]